MYEQALLAEARNKALMPTVLRDGPYRFLFYAANLIEPVHIHVQRDRNIAKFWLDPVRLASAGGFRRPELRRIMRKIEEHEALFIEAWNAFPRR